MIFSREGGAREEKLHFFMEKRKSYILRAMSLLARPPPENLIQSADQNVN